MQKVQIAANEIEKATNQVAATPEANKRVKTYVVVDPSPFKLSNLLWSGWTGLLTFFGRAGKSMVIRSGRLTSKYAIEKQSGVYNVAARTAAKLLPSGMQVKLVLDSMANGYNKLYAESGQELHFSVEDRGNHWAFISVECPLCAGKTSDQPMCWGRIGTLKEGVLWLTGKEFDVEEVECRALGAPACVWEISKTPKG